MAVVQLTPKYQRLQELASQALEEQPGEFAGRRALKRVAGMFMPDPFNPASYLFPVGLSRGETFKQALEPMLLESGKFRSSKQIPPIVSDFVRAIMGTPEKELAPLKQISYTPSSSSSFYPNYRYELLSRLGPELEATTPRIEIGKATSPWSLARNFLHELMHNWQNVEMPQLFVDPNFYYKYTPEVETATAWLTRQRAQQLGMRELPSPRGLATLPNLTYRNPEVEHTLRRWQNFLKSEDPFQAVKEYLEGVHTQHQHFLHEYGQPK